MAVIGDHIFKQSLTDRCYIDTRATGNEWGSSRAAITYTEGTDLTACRVVRHKAEEIPGGSKARVIDAAIFLPASVTPAEDDRIRLIKHAGVTLNTPESFGVVTLEKQGYGNKAECKEAKGGTVI